MYQDYTQNQQEETAEYTPPNFYPDTSDPLVSIENLKFIEGNDDMEDLYRMLAGYIQDEKGNWVQKGNKLMNDNGLKATRSLIGIMAGKQSKMSKIEGFNISKIQIDFCKKYAVQLAFRMEEWGVSSTDYHMVHTLVTNFVYFSLKRSEDAHEKWFLRASQFGVYAPIATQQQVQQKKSFFRRN